MAIAPAPHPPSVFRYLKQAWREYLVSGTAVTLTVNTPATQPAANPLTVTGVCVGDVSVPKPIQVVVNLQKSAAFQAQQVAYADPVTGAWTVTYPGGSTTATAAASAVAFAFSNGINLFGVTTSNFTLT